MAKKDGKLAEVEKAFLVKRFACFDSPTQAVAALAAEFGVSVTRQSAERYDPTSKAGANLAPHLRAIYDAERKRFLEGIDEIAISHVAVRLRRLDRMATSAEERGNFVLAASLIEQAAKERGGSFTNRRELTGKDGDAMQYREVSTKTYEETMAELYALLGRPPPEPATL